jgi:hypothetical protein
MGIRATVVGELARIEQTSNGSTLFDVCVRTKSGPVNIVGFSSDTNAGKAFKAGNLVCMQGNAAFREFNDETSFQMTGSASWALGYARGGSRNAGCQKQGWYVEGGPTILIWVRKVRR